MSTLSLVDCLYFCIQIDFSIYIRSDYILTLKLHGMVGVLSAKGILRKESIYFLVLSIWSYSPTLISKIQVFRGGRDG